MGKVTLPRTNQTGTNEWSDVESNDVALANEINGNLNNENIATGAEIAPTKLASSFLEKVGVDGSSAVRRGKSIIATEESRTNTGYGTLTTPDRVQGIVMPTDGLIAIAYRGLWKGSATVVSGSIADAAIFIGPEQLKITGATTQAVRIEDGSAGDTTNIWQRIYTGPEGLSGSWDTVGHAALATTGMIVNPLYVFASAGTYDISVRFKAPSGTVSAKERKLWVWTLGF